MAADSLPREIQDRLAAFDDGLNKVEDQLNELQSVPMSDLHAEMSALDKAKLDLLGAYAVNSLFWMYLNVKGDNPQEHAVKQELERIKSYMGRVKEIQDKEKAPKLDRGAAKRFIRSAMWEQAHKKATTGNESANISSENSRSQETTEQDDSERPTKKVKVSDKTHKKKKKKSR